MRRINPNHQNQRNVLRVVGPTILVVGLGFIAVGMISFFSAFSGNGRPQYFWCMFVGMPLLFVGLVLCKFAFMGKVARYAAGELAPVGKDTFNYMASETQEGFSNLSRAVYEGVQQSKGDSIADRIRKLEGLKQSGLITEEDFEEQKDRILSEL
tara:strand:+ start:38520 stop:38981 length:462 start_codon:yes stop_codon:yes gene_type:complete